MSVEDDTKEVGRGQESGESNTECAQDATEVVVNCGSSLDISMVKNLSDELQSALSQDKPVVLDGEDVENADGAAMQLLFAFFHDAKAKGLELSWKEPSETLKRSASLLGMTDQLLLNNS